MPLIVGNVRASDENVLTGTVVEGRLFHAKLKNSRWMSNGLHNDTALRSTEDANNTFDGIENERSDSPDPEISRFQDTVHTVTNKASVEDNEHMVGKPERLEARTANGING